jgi:elongation factor 1-gamma
VGQHFSQSKINRLLFLSFDKEGFSVWRCDFKYNEELTLVFMSSNQIGGFFNRLEASRKYLFGSLGVLGETNKSVISGVFITRGDDIKLSVDCAPDWESYEYKKLDLTNESDKKYFEDALAWDLELDGKKWADGKNVSPLEPVKTSSVADELPFSLVQVN